MKAINELFKQIYTPEYFGRYFPYDGYEFTDGHIKYNSDIITSIFI